MAAARRTWHSKQQREMASLTYDLGLNTVEAVTYHGLAHKIERRNLCFVVVSPQAPSAAGASWSDREGMAVRR